MKKFLIIFTLLIASRAFTADLFLVKIPVPNKGVVTGVPDFNLFHRAGDYWIGSVPEGTTLPDKWENLGTIDQSKGELYRLTFPSAEEFGKISGIVQVLYQSENEAIIQFKPEIMNTFPSMKAEWIHIPIDALPQGYSGVEIPQTDTFHPLCQDFVDAVSFDQYLAYLQAL